MVQYFIWIRPNSYQISKLMLIWFSKSQFGQVSLYRTLCSYSLIIWKSNPILSFQKGSYEEYKMVASPFSFRFCTMAPLQPSHPLDTSSSKSIFLNTGSHHEHNSVQNDLLLHQQLLLKEYKYIKLEFKVNKYIYSNIT